MTRPPKESPVDRALFREVVGHFMTGVTAITTQAEGERHGLTASAVASLSLDPPMLLVCLNRDSRTCQAVGRAGVFAVNVLDEDQGQLAAQFATAGGDDKFGGLRIDRGELGVPVLTNALARIECRVAEAIDAATHTIFLGEVHAAQARPGSPLAYFRGSFGRFEHALDEAVYEQIRSRVLDRTFALDEELTVEGLTRALGIAAAPAYHALQQLRAERLVSADPERGYVVTPITVEAAWAAYDARAAIECGVADQVAPGIEPADAARLKAAAQATTPWIRDGRFVDFERFVATNSAFHQLLVGLTGNAMLVEAYGRLGMGGLMSRALGSLPETDDAMARVHVDIAEAFEARDATQARRRILEHAHVGKERAKRALEAVGGRY